MREDPQIVAAPDHWLATLIQALEKRLDVLRSRSRCLTRATPRRGNLSLRAPAASSRIVWPGCIDEPVRYPAVTLKQAVPGCAPTPRRGVLTRRRLQRSDRARPSEESQRTSNRHTPVPLRLPPNVAPLAPTTYPQSAY